MILQRNVTEDQDRRESPPRRPKKRKEQHEDSDKALVDSEEEVNVAPSRKARKVSIGDVPAAPAEPDAPRDTPTANQVIGRAE